jgi:hypothetical protein
VSAVFVVVVFVLHKVVDCFLSMLALAHRLGQRLARPLAGPSGRHPTVCLQSSLNTWSLTKPSIEGLIVEGARGW